MNITGKDIARQVLLSLLATLIVAQLVRRVPPLRAYIKAQWEP